MRTFKNKIKNCKKCTLCDDRENIVIGSGNEKANILFIGEAPGEKEDISGVPFCGKSGKILDELLASIKLDRNDIYITNIVKCKPPDNRDPTPLEIKVCTAYLDEQIFLINPKVICTLGRHAMNFIKLKYGLEDITTITNTHGKVFEEIEQIIIPLYHPAVALYDPTKKKELLKDFKIVKKYASKNIN